MLMLQPTPPFGYFTALRGFINGFDNMDVNLYDYNGVRPTADAQYPNEETCPEWSWFEKPLKRAGLERLPDCQKRMGSLTMVREESGQQRN